MTHTEKCYTKTNIRRTYYHKNLQRDNGKTEIKDNFTICKNKKGHHEKFQKANENTKIK